MKFPSSSRRLLGGFLNVVFLAAGLGWAGLVWAADAPAPDTTAAPADATPAPSDNVQNSVVKIFSTMRYPDPYKPWTKQAPREASGTGVIIEGNRILTNAHMVLYASEIQVQANASGDKVSATVAAVAPGIDLAVLTVDDPTFFNGRPALPRASTIPEIKDPVMVYGYPTGGDNLSITKGIVSRIEFAEYNDFTDGLRIQIDAAINPGNSGGPAVVGNQMVGLAFSHLGNAQNIGYIIPCEEIELFLKDVASGHYTGKPAMYDELQTLENPALRPFLKIDSSVHGIIVNDPFSDAPDYPLKKWDVITKIGDTPIDDQGMITVGDDLRLRFQYMVQKISKDGKVPLTVVRGGKEIDVQLPVGPSRPMLIPTLAGKYPSYYVFGPMVFTAATQEFLEGLNTEDTFLSFIGSPLITRQGDKPAFPGEQLVVVASPFFDDKLALGYEPEPVAWVVKSVNGIQIKNLQHLVQVLNDSKDEFLTFEFEGLGLETFVFPRQAMKDATDGILSDNDIRTQGSPDVMEAPSTDQPAK